jgi:hypothetical protein
MELVLRFLVFRTLAPASFANLGDIGDFLTENAKDLAKDKSFDLKKEGLVFHDTFSLLASTVGDDAFRRYDQSKKRFLGGFSVSAFEAVAIGIGYNPKKAASDPASIVEKVKKMWSTAQFVDNSGSGIRASSRVPKIIPYGRSTFAS